MSQPSARRTERLFTAALLVKGIDGAAELVGAVALLLFLAVLNIAIIVVIVREYRLLRRAQTGVSPGR